MSWQWPQVVTKINLLMANGHFIAKWQMATSLLNGKWPLLYQLWQMATLLIWQLANLFMADGHRVAQSLVIMVIATVIRVKNG